MSSLPKDSREFIELLNSNRVRYLVVGGFAVAAHGYARLTEDIDFFIDSSRENAERVVEVLGKFGFGSLNLTVDDFTASGRIIQLGYPPNRIDIITSISGVSFEDAWQGRLEADLDGVPTKFIGKDSLIKNKEATGRKKDRRDVGELP